MTISHDFRNIFAKWLLHVVKTPIKMIHLYKMCSNTFSFRKHFGTVLTEEIQIAKFCTEVFVITKHLMTKINKPESFLYMSPVFAIVLSKHYTIVSSENSASIHETSQLSFLPKMITKLQVLFEKSIYCKCQKKYITNSILLKGTKS